MASKYLTNNPSKAIDECVASLNPDKVLIVTDQNVATKVIDQILIDSMVIKESQKISIPAGEDGKTLDTVVKIWQKLEYIGATRKSLVLNIGGGVVTDLGGFAAATFKRGIATVNFPTTLLGAVDAATGGKTGINFQGLKNEIGSFHKPRKVIISPEPFKSLNFKEIKSGYAEMIKTAIISDRDFYIRLLDMEKIIGDSEQLGEAVAKCVEIKESVVEQDPNEQGLRKILNFGHTAGHAFESIRNNYPLETFSLPSEIEGCNPDDKTFLKDPLPHGNAVAHGMLVALILSHIELGFDSQEITHYSRFLKENYGPAVISCEEIDLAIEKMSRDKKNSSYGVPNFTLLRSLGVPEINCQPSISSIRESLEIYRDLTT